MSVKENIAIAREFIERVWNEQDLSVIDELIASDHINHDPMEDQFPPGREGLKLFTSTMQGAFPDSHMTIGNQQADGDLVRTEWTARGTQTGQLMDIPATGRKVTVHGVTTDRIAGGQIVESWTEWDPQDMMRQLGVG